MAANEITVSGFTELHAKLTNAPAEVLELTDEAARFAATTWEELSKVAAPADFGFLRGGINHHQVAQNDWEVTSSKFYSPYLEWGTKTHVSVPVELSAYASQFKKKGPPGGAEAIYEWCRRVGIPRNAWVFVYISIMKKGIRPHPFFFVQRPIVEKQFLLDLETVMNTPL